MTPSPDIKPTLSTPPPPELGSSALDAPGEPVTPTKGKKGGAGQKRKSPAKPKAKGKGKSNDEGPADEVVKHAEVETTTTPSSSKRKAESVLKVKAEESDKDDAPSPKAKKARSPKKPTAAASGESGNDAGLTESGPVCMYDEPGWTPDKREAMFGKLLAIGIKAFKTDDLAVEVRSSLSYA